MNHEGPIGAKSGAGPVAARWAVVGTLALAVVAFGAFALLRTPPAPPPKEIAGDPLLVEGRAIYLDRCVSCHGLKGRGDGPIARTLAGPPVGNLTDATWKNGDAPDQVRAVVARGVPGTAMPGWGRTIGDDGVRAASAYVYYLSGRVVPRELRAE